MSGCNLEVVVGGDVDCVGGGGDTEGFDLGLDAVGAKELQVGSKALKSFYLGR